MPVLAGVFVPFVTPFTIHDELDIDALHSHIDFLIGEGVHGLVPAGSTGESQSLTSAEYRVLIRETVEHVNGRVPVLAGASANSTRQVIENSRYAEEIGATGVMITHPFYSLPDQDELYAHYELIASSIDVPIMIYNNPFTTGVDSPPELLARLSYLDNIDYVKESSNDVTRIMRIIEQSDGRMTVFSGTDNQVYEHLSVGAVGWVAGAANVLPRLCTDLYLLVTQGQLDEALRLYRQLYDYLTVCEDAGKFVQVAKAGIEFIGRSVGPPRRPLLPLSPEMRQRIQFAIERAQGAMSEIHQPDLVRSTVADGNKVANR